MNLYIATETNKGYKIGITSSDSIKLYRQYRRASPKFEILFFCRIENAKQIEQEILKIFDNKRIIGDNKKSEWIDCEYQELFKEVIKLLNIEINKIEKKVINVKEQIEKLHFVKIKDKLAIYTDRLILSSDLLQKEIPDFGSCFQNYYWFSYSLRSKRLINGDVKEENLTLSRILSLYNNLFNEKVESNNFYDNLYKILYALFICNAIINDNLVLEKDNVIYGFPSSEILYNIHNIYVTKKWIQDNLYFKLINKKNKFSFVSIKSNKKGINIINDVYYICEKYEEYIKLLVLTTKWLEERGYEVEVPKIPGIYNKFTDLPDAWGELEKKLQEKVSKIN
ncbi:MAG: GIY-YIG nuclease family protein [Nitrososphaerota archaeon]